MWCDDFDMDLYKVLPDAKRLLEPVANLRLYTTGHMTDGALNHPSTWGIRAYFGFRLSEELPARGCQPEGHWTDSPVIGCTVEEAFRDVWPHTLIMIVEGYEVWNAHALWTQFERLMSSLRGWQQYDAELLDMDRKWVLCSIGEAARRIERLREGLCRYAGS
jgi:hypothetical protein